MSAPPIKSWSYSRLLDFEQCPYRAFLKIVERLPDPSTPAADRGTQIHTAAENYVNGSGDLVSEMNDFAAEFASLRDLYKEGKVSLEGEWALNKDWEPCDWKDRSAWSRMKLDACVFMNKTTACVIDYKTGKKYGNEIKHAEQGQLYALGVFVRYPQIQQAEVEFWYLDQNDILPARYTRAEAINLMRAFEKRARAMTTATEFPPNPNIFTCKWCPYSPRAGGQCKAGV
jgi:RecB family exonuclease